jgi:transposase-like protein
VVCLVILWRFRYKRSLRDMAEMFFQRGISFTHEAVREWERKLAPLLSEALRKRRRSQVGNSWYVDETYIVTTKEPSRNKFYDLRVIFVFDCESRCGRIV